MIKKIQAWAQILYVVGVFLASFVFFEAAKYDTADRIWLVLLLGVTILALPLLFGMQGIKNHPYMAILLTGLSVWFWIAYFYSPIKNYGFTEVVILNWAAMLAIFVSGASEFVKKNLARTVLYIGVICALYAFWYFPLHGEARMAGLFFDASDPRHFFPNAMGTFLLMAWPLLFIYGPSSRLGKIFIGGIFLASMYLTYSRGTWIMAVFQILLIAPVFFRYIKKYSRSLVWTLVFGLFCIALLSSLRNENFATISAVDKLEFAGSEQNTSVDSRKDFWNAAYTITTENPLLGAGPMSFRYLYPQYQKHFLGNTDHPHNWILKLSSEEGLPAALLFSLIVVSSFVFVYKHFRDHLGKYLLVVAWVGALAHSMIDYNMNFIPTIAAFFILLAISWPGELSPKLSSAKAKRTIQVMTLLLLIFITGVSMRELMLVYRTKIAQASSNIEGAVQIQSTALTSREFIRTAALEAETKNQSEKFLSIHLTKNPLDAVTWYLLGNSKKAIELDPKNRLAYYRLYLEQFGNHRDDVVIQNLQQILFEYDQLLQNNVYYTAFTDNVQEASKIYLLMGNSYKADWIEKTADEVRRKTADVQNFNKLLAPRTLLEIFVKK